MEVGGRRRRRRWFLGKPQFILLLQYPHQFFFATTDPGGWCGTNFRHCGTNSAEICSLLDYRKKERETIAATIRVENLHHTSSSCKRQIFPGQILRRRRQNFTDFIYFSNYVLFLMENFEIYHDDVLLILFWLLIFLVSFRVVVEMCVT